jgi:cytochrome c oxidase subunit 2
MNRLRAAVVLLLAVTGCSPVDAPMTTFAPKSNFAEAIHRLYLQVIGWDSLIFIIVAVALFLALMRYSTRQRDDGGRLPVYREHIGLEVAWTLGPALVLLAIAIPTVRTTFHSQPAVPPANALKVRITAHQWWWQVEYPDLALTTANEIHLPAGRHIWLLLESADVIHSFWVPQLGGKRDVIPGHTNTLHFVPEVPGTYLGQCAEFCGLSHANMRFRVFVETPDAFRDWAAHQRSPAISPGRPLDISSPVAAGARLFASSPCVACHTVRGVSTQRVGPDLTHFGSRTTLAAGILSNTSENLTTWLRDPPAVKPGTMMPALGLSSAQISELVAYLESLK